MTQRALPGMAKYRPRDSKQAGFKRGRPEFDAQCCLFTFLRAHKHKHPALGLPFAVPNGLGLLPGVPGQAVAQGVKAGVWDILVPNVGGGLWLEMKAGKNGLTQTQLSFRAEMEPLGFRFAVCYDWISAARLILAEYGIEDADIERGLKG